MNIDSIMPTERLSKVPSAHVHHSHFQTHGTDQQGGADKKIDQLLKVLTEVICLLSPIFNKDAGQQHTSDASPKDDPILRKIDHDSGHRYQEQKSPSQATSPVQPNGGEPKTHEPGMNSHSLKEAREQTDVKFMPVLRGDEKAKDAKIKSQADFGQAADEVAKEYGLDPTMFRAQLQAESGAFTQGYQNAMKHEGDLDRRGENNTSIGLGQISRKFLDGREWSQGGPGNERTGKQVVSTEQYEKSPTVQLRMAASNLAQRVADNKSVESGLSSYVSGDPDPSNPKAAQYIENIEKWMKDPQVTEPGRS